MFKKKEIPDSMMFLDMLIDAGKVPKAVVIANTEKKEEIYNIDEEREEYLKNLANLNAKCSYIKKHEQLEEVFSDFSSKLSKK